MKQHVTLKQFNELEKDQQKKWFDFIGIGFISIGGEFSATYIPGTFQVMHDSKDYSFLPSIGQMIEFIVDNGHPITSTYIDVALPYIISFGYESGDKEQIEIGWSNYMGKSEELCDALWEAVKSILEKEHTNP